MVVVVVAVAVAVVVVVVVLVVVVAVVAAVVLVLIAVVAVAVAVAVVVVAVSFKKTSIHLKNVGYLSVSFQVCLPMMEALVLEPRKRTNDNVQKTSHFNEDMYLV